jgi:hypothetical protein
MRVIAALLLMLEPLHFAGEGLSVLSTIAYRGTIAALELVVHALVAALGAAGALALVNGAPSGRVIATTAIAASALRAWQSLYWSALPNDTPPGDESLVALTTVVVAAIALVLVRRARP